MINPRPFQQETIKAVLNAFSAPASPRRFLVADEVGLGKTIVAQGVIHGLMQKKRGPLSVFYVCSNLSIASQNREKLLEVLEIEDERKQARCLIDRLTLIPAMSPTSFPQHRKLHLYTLTPETSMPIRKGKRRDGRKEERALIHHLVKAIWPSFFQAKSVPEDYFRGSVTRDNWQNYLHGQRAKVEGNTSLQQAFRKAIQAEFNLTHGRQLIAAFKQQGKNKLIGAMRNALAAIALDVVKPDLIIFDEFQRFNDLIKSNIDQLPDYLTEAEQRIMRAQRRIIAKLYGIDRQKPPALLLLSATPYRLYTQRVEETHSSPHHQEFFDLVAFLYRDPHIAQQKRAECEKYLSILAGTLQQGQFHSPEAQHARQQIEMQLRPVMARTERAAFQAGDATEGFCQLKTPLHPDDLRVYCHLNQSLTDHHQTGAVPYWISIPLPMQSMSQQYITWRAAKSIADPELPSLNEAQRNQFNRPDVWPHPRLRTLEQDLMPVEHLALPWMPPSLPWWSLSGEWAKTNRPTKLLIFSRFRAAPQAIAALLSYNLETQLLAQEKHLNYADATRRKSLQAKAGRIPLVALFHPSPWLIKSTDPLLAKSDNLDEVKTHLKKQLGAALKKLGVRLVKKTAAARPIWQLLFQIEKKAEGDWILGIWWDMHYERQKSSHGRTNEDAGLGRLLKPIDTEADQPLEFITEQEVVELADFALSAPGIVLGRALSRHWNEAITDGFYLTLDVAWNGLRTYLDQRWFFAALKSGNDERYPDAIRQAVIAGNLEAVLDEYLWITSQIRSQQGATLARTLLSSLSLRSSVFNLHQAGDKEADTFSLRCHTALPFTQAKNQTLTVTTLEGQPQSSSFRPDDLRHAFNSPFWPHVLTTTSVGQEGLDFHVWCNSLVHWDLCSNPVDLEQREGRIQRYGGLAVRQAIAQKLGSRLWANLKQGQSPWKMLGELADEWGKTLDPSGLSPWWICEGATINRYLFDVPLSEQAHRLAWLQQQRLLYRLVLGQPNQEDLVEVLARHNDMNTPAVQQAILQLSPWFYNNHVNEKG